MKITINIDCTPEEARTFLGLPDVKPLQETLLRQLQERMAAGLQATDAETLVKAWLPAGLQGLEQIQRFLWTQMAAAAGWAGSTGSDKTKDDASKDDKP